MGDIKSRSSLQERNNNEINLIKFNIILLVEVEKDNQKII